MLGRLDVELRDLGDKALKNIARPVRVYSVCPCVAKMLLGQDQDALAWGRRAVETNRGYPMARFHYAAALARNSQAGSE
ncbi:hypothetical protein DFR50_12680 [Roseiarcus fermentans]|uniref:Uncharacterized protein n=1 Tax=Roseiarcus fermentans TaxID=1473586 RepID=A0A366F3E5_9HYPH|nr:hypothetical protein [Roseiarcus fermentans]RBP08235.1 hypothetical protein DFR50_12680 [Roseiarcus fermentans]